MKKIASILVLVFAFTITTQAQKKRKQERPQLTTEQKVDLAVKKMALNLDLSAAQQNKIKPLIAQKMANHKSMIEKRRALRKADKKPTSDEIYEMRSKQLDNQIAMKKEMKNILNKDQFEKFEKMNKGRKMKFARKMKNAKEDGKNRKMLKNRKEKKEQRG